MTDEQRAEKLKGMKERTKLMAEHIGTLMENPFITAMQKAILLSALTDVRYGDDLMTQMINYDISPFDKRIEEFMNITLPRTIVAVGKVIKEIDDQGKNGGIL